MNIFKNNLSKNIPKKEWVVESFETNFEDYFTRQISIREYLFITGTLTADLIAYNNKDVRISQKVYESIMMMAINYYTFLFAVDIHTSFYTLSKSNVYNQVVKLMAVILDKYGGNDFYNISGEIDEAIYNSNDFTLALVEVFYGEGHEGCRKYLTSAINAELEANNKRLALNLSQNNSFIDNAILF